ncbi:ribosome maturation factor RimP [Arcobacter cryaerophilus gv. occultus]|uniref:ribosome maturation factor RimP n=1 Tax=Aliarcobacter cryaerophilus TaxID=28198 RepID=UPI000D01389C|nr:ribosome maturation factor RimP [Aliarcobacter cryaerophilus]PRM92079.1 ribosome maturation factor RimP [Arcobacter cryaerophilus gv. occultus]
MNLEEQIKLIVENSGLKLYDIVTKKEHERNIFRVIVTSKDGVNLDKCAEISRLISPILDIDEPMGGKYNLEVSSPGIERKLKKPEHFISSIGELVKVKNIETDLLKGELLSADNSKITIKTEFGDEEITYDNILSAATYFEW